MPCMSRAGKRSRMELKDLFYSPDQLHYFDDGVEICYQ
jgi:hypothetical protein